MTRALWLRLQRWWYDGGTKCPRCGDTVDSMILHYWPCCSWCEMVERRDTLAMIRARENETRQPKSLFAEARP